MKKLLALLVVVLSTVTLHAQGVWTEQNIDPDTGLKTGVFEVNGSSFTIGPKADLRDANLSGANLIYANLVDADLQGAKLNDADLTLANLNGASLYNANLYNAYLVDTDLNGADLNDANLTLANLVGASLSGADLRGIIFNEDILPLLIGGVSRGNYIEIEALKPQVEANTAKVGITAEQVNSIQSNTTEIDDLKIMMEAMNVQMQQLNTQLGDLQASIEEKDQQIAELSQRPTLEEVQDARAGSLVFRADEETNAVTLEFEIRSSENLQDWVAQPETVTATVPLDAEKKFVRIALAKE